MVSRSTLSHSTRPRKARESGTYMLLEMSTPRHQSKNFSCGGYGCMDLSTRPGRQADKFFKDRKGAKEESDNNRIVADSLDKDVLARYTLFTNGSVKDMSTLCHPVRGEADMRLLGKLAMASNFEAFTSGATEVCSLRYIKGEGDMDSIVRSMVRTCQENGFDLKGACARFVRELVSGVLDVRDHFLTAMHDKDLFHMDMKPENLVLMRRKGSVEIKVIDFGLMEVLRPEALPLKRFPPQGTAHLMSPVSLLSSSGHPGHWTDVDVESVLRHRWRSNTIKGMLTLCGSGYFKLLAQIMNALPRCLGDMHKMRYLLAKCDDYSVAITCMELWPNMGSIDESMPGVKQRLRELVTYDVDAVM